jgi:tRNA pseudouridine55 synthase
MSAHAPFGRCPPGGLEQRPGEAGSVLGLGSGTAASRATTRSPRRALHGVLLLDKPLGWTSHDALAKAKGLLRAEKGGHTGTLDPLATGLLPLCFGAATKFGQASLDADKRYRATLRLGQTTTTGDGEGEITAERPLDGLRHSDLEAACGAFMGEIEQLPPMHSALKHQGRALYEYARAGQTVERQPRRVMIHALDIVHWHDAELVIDVHCSKGTYVRTLAEDIGTRLGCGAHLAALRRTGSGPLDLGQAVTMEQLRALDEPARQALLLPPDVLLSAWPAVDLPDAEAARLLTGLRRRVSLADAPAVRVYRQPQVAVPTLRLPGSMPAAPAASAASADFLGTAHIAGGELIPDRLLSPNEVQALAA